tara:strand:+ start:148 stop:390 length:243 start_codon:yes stop_codon:yes gene_type:complete
VGAKRQGVQGNAMTKFRGAVIYNSEGEITDVVAVSSIPIADICQQLLPEGSEVVYLDEHAKEIEDELGNWQVTNGYVTEK